MANNFNKKPPHRKVTPLIAGLCMAMGGVQIKIHGKDPMLTKETAKTAAAKVRFDNNKIQQHFPEFRIHAR
jgi:dihydroflavonol-4-reductase